MAGFTETQSLGAILVKGWSRGKNTETYPLSKNFGHLERGRVWEIFGIFEWKNGQKVVKKVEPCPFPPKFDPVKMGSFWKLRKFQPKGGQTMAKLPHFPKFSQIPKKVVKFTPSPPKLSTLNTT